MDITHTYRMAPGQSDAWYDRSSRMGVAVRFSLMQSCRDKARETNGVCQIRDDNGKVVYRSNAFWDGANEV